MKLNFLKEKIIQILLDKEILIYCLKGHEYSLYSLQMILLNSSSSINIIKKEY